MNPCLRNCISDFTKRYPLNSKGTVSVILSDLPCVRRVQRYVCLTLSKPACLVFCCVQCEMCTV